MIQFESHKVEFPFPVFFENDDDILEFYDQPVPVKLTYNNIKGRHLGVVTTPDYFTIRSDGTAGWEECKQEEELISLSKKHQNDFAEMNMDADAHHLASSTPVSSASISK